MPILRYFVTVGGVLLALLLVSNVMLPKPAEPPQRGDIDRSIIRINTTRKGPERVVIDASIPTVVPPTSATAVAAPPPPPPVSNADASPAAAGPLAAYAQIEPTPTKKSSLKKKVARAAAHRRYAALPRQITPAQQWPWHPPQLRPRPRQFAGFAPG